jgi:AcrR family transcriptional regulator
MPVKSKTVGRTRRPLSREVVLSEALHVVDAEGLKALSMRRLAARLGIEAMTLYHYVDGKEAILDGVYELVIREIELPPSELPWDTRLTVLLASFRAVLKRHPQAVPVILARRADYPGVWSSANTKTTAVGLAFREAQLKTLEDAGLSQRAVRRWYRIIAAFSMGFVVNEIQWDADSALPQALAGREGGDLRPKVAGARPVKSDSDTTFASALAVFVRAIEAETGVNSPPQARAR